MRDGRAFASHLVAGQGIFFSLVPSRETNPTAPREPNRHIAASGRQQGETAPRGQGADQDERTAGGGWNVPQAEAGVVAVSAGSGLSVPTLMVGPVFPKRNFVPKLSLPNRGVF